MNPLQALNAQLWAKEKAAQKRSRARKAAILSTGLSLTLMMGIALCAQYQVKQKSAIIVVATEDDNEPLPPPVSKESVPSIAEVLEVRPHSSTLQEGLDRLHIQTLAYAAADATAHPDTPKVRLASRSASFVPELKREQSKAAVKPAPEQKMAPAPAQVRLSSDNWAQLTKFQKWKFVEGYLKSKHWVCPPSGMTKPEEMEELNKHDWSTIQNFGFANCAAQS